MQPALILADLAWLCRFLIQKVLDGSRGFRDPAGDIDSFAPEDKKAMCLGNERKPVCSKHPINSWGIGSRHLVDPDPKLYADLLLTAQSREQCVFRAACPTALNERRHGLVSTFISAVRQRPHKLERLHQVNHTTGCKCRADGARGRLQRYLWKASQLVTAVHDYRLSLKY